MELGGRGVGIVTSNGAPMRIPAGTRIVKVVCTLLGDSRDASARVLLGVRSLAAPTEQRAEHVLGAVLLARPEEPRVVTPERRSGTSASVERILFSELVEARGVVDVTFLVTCAQAAPEPFEAVSVEARLFAETALVSRARVLNAARQYYACVAPTYGGPSIEIPLIADSGCTSVVTATGIEVTTLTSTVAALRTAACTIGRTRYAESLTTLPIADTTLGLDVPAGYVMQKSAATVALPLVLRDSAGEISAASVVERFGEYPTIKLSGFSTLTAVSGVYMLDVSADADVALSITEARAGGSRLAVTPVTRTVVARAPPSKAAFLGTPWQAATNAFVVRLSTAASATCVATAISRATVRTTTGAEFRARPTANGDVTVSMPENVAVYSATLTGIVCADGTRAAELTAYAPQDVRLVAKTRGGEALVYGTGATLLTVEAHRKHGVGALGAALSVVAKPGFTYSSASGGTLTVTTPITAAGTTEVAFASVSGTATGDDSNPITVSATDVSALVIGTSTRLVGTPLFLATELGTEIEASVATGSCFVSKLRVPLLGTPAPKLEPTTSVAVGGVGGSGSVTSTDVTWTPSAQYAPSGTPTLVLTNVGCALGDRKTTIASFSYEMNATRTYSLALVATTEYNFGVASGALIVEGDPSLPKPLTGAFSGTFGTVGTIYLGLKVDGGDQAIVACANVSFTNAGDQVAGAQDYAKRSVAQQEVLTRGTDPYWRLVKHDATTVLGIFVGTNVSIKSVTVGVCAASGGRVAATLVYTK
jgi:hypothetical protein